MKRSLVCGAGGFTLAPGASTGVGGHLVNKLKNERYRVRGVDIKKHEFAPTQADEFLLLDLRRPENCRAALSVDGDAFDEVYQLAADMGGMGFIHSAECDIMRNSALTNIHMIDTAARMGVPRYFSSSSVCVYRDMKPGKPEMTGDWLCSSAPAAVGPGAIWLAAGGLAGHGTGGPLYAGVTAARPSGRMSQPFGCAQDASQVCITVTATDRPGSMAEAEEEKAV